MQGDHTGISMSDPEGIAVVALTALVYLGVRLLPRLIAGARSFSSPAEVQRKLKNGEPILLLDVRARTEFVSDLGHVQESVNIPLDELKARLREPEFLERCRSVVVVVICQTDARAAFAVRRLRRSGIPNAFALSGGLSAWVDAGYPLRRWTDRG